MFGQNQHSALKTRKSCDGVFLGYAPDQGNRMHSATFFYLVAGHKTIPWKLSANGPDLVHIGSQAVVL